MAEYKTIAKYPLVINKHSKEINCRVLVRILEENLNALKPFYVVVILYWHNQILFGKQFTASS